MKKLKLIYILKRIEKVQTYLRLFFFRKEEERGIKMFALCVRACMCACVCATVTAVDSSARGLVPEGGSHLWVVRRVSHPGHDHLCHCVKSIGWESTGLGFVRAGEDREKEERKNQVRLVQLHPSD